MLAAAWLVLCAAFFGALLASRALPVKGSGGALSFAGIFQDLIRYGKTKSACGQRPALLQTLDVPKRWFYHFYIVSVAWNGFLLLLVSQSAFLSWPFPIWLQDLLNICDGALVSGDRVIHPSENGAEFLSAFLVFLLLWINSCRRLKECLHVSVYSGGVIHIIQYCFGLFYYVLVGLTVMCQVPANIREGKDHWLSVRWYHILGLLMFCWAAGHQHRCHVILANLRKDKAGKVSNVDYKIPFGDWFEMVSCPHYFAEFLIYLSMSVTFGCHNLTWWLVVTYVFLIQALSALLCQEYYVNNFKHYPKGRKAFIPFIF